MTRTMARTERAAPRRWWVHVLAVALCVLGAVGGYIGGIVTLLTDYPACMADFSEDTIVAPNSNRGWLLCSVTRDGELSDRGFVLFILLGVPVLLALIGLVVWVRVKRLAVLLPLLVLAVLLPWVWGGVVAVLSPDCNDYQWAEHGAGGCERSEEERPGLNQYY